MRWEALFADLEAAAQAQEKLVFEAEVADQVRAEWAAITLTDRVRAQLGEPLVCQLLDGDRLQGQVVDAGADWLLLATGPGSAHWLVPVAALASLSGLSPAAAAPGALARRLRLTVLLRALATDRARVQLRIRSGGSLTGTIDRVGADHLDLALHPEDEPRRRSAVLEVRSIPLSAILAVRAS